MSLLEALKLPVPKRGASGLATPSKAAAGAKAVSPAAAAGALPVTAQAAGAQPTAVTAPGKVDVGKPMSTAEMPVEDIAAAIMDRQVAILIGWETALEVFDKTMTSASDAEAKPDFQQVVVKHFADKLMGALMKHGPGVSELDAAVKALEGEYQRAATAKGSGTLRDFVVQHTKAIGQVHQTILKERQGFISAVRARRQALEAEIAKVPKPKKGAPPKPSAPAIALGAMRIVLQDTYDSVDRVLSVSNEATLFRVLSEQWMKHATVYAGMGLRVKGVVVIRLSPDYSIKDAHIQGSGGQKIAEQLIKDSDSGTVDVFKLKAQRRVLLMAANGYPKVILTLDENNADISTGSFAEGDTTSLRTYLLKHGLPPTSKLTGD